MLWLFSRIFIKTGKFGLLFFSLPITEKLSLSGLLTYSSMRSQMDIVLSCYVCGYLLHSNRKQIRINDTLFSF